ncbi:MAG: DUF1972 domain-containing protein [Puia sp.]|nr:DUF1972 domain-containing protein [Puia sp.]
MKIAIIGTRGIPNHYGGFEQLAEHLSVRLYEKGHAVTVYNSHRHPYRESGWRGVQLIHCKDPEAKLGTAGQFIYDLNCLLDARKRKFDVILALGYTSFSLWGRLLPRDSVTVINMDGLEWKRTKYSKPVRRFLRYAEGLAIRYCDRYIADSPAIRDYLKEKYGVDSEYIAYGAELFTGEEEGLLQAFKVEKGDYCMLMARMEPENNIEMIAEGFRDSHSAKKLLIIGNTGNAFGQYLVKKFGGDKRIVFAGAIYDAKKIHALKAFSSLYFHGHSVGGTNPSLLEAMASRALIAAHDNPFNKAILGPDALYFSSHREVSVLVEQIDRDESFREGAPKKETGSDRERMIGNNLEKIREHFNWGKIADQYEQYLLASYRERSVKASEGR